MKQYVVINNSLGMSKGKIARMCLSAGTNAHKLLPGSLRKWKWVLNGKTAVVLKTDKFEELLNFLEVFKIKHHVHIDAGRTQVEAGSKCSVTFFHKGCEALDNFKLY